MTRLHWFCAVLCAGGISIAQDAARAPGWVVIPLAEYGSLHSKAYPVEREADPPPVEATLTRIDYDLRLDGALAAGSAGLTVDVLKDGWVRVPIPSGLLVRDAKLGGKPVSLVATAGKSSQLYAVLSGRGRSVLRLEVAFPVATGSGEERLSLAAGG